MKRFFNRPLSPHLTVYVPQFTSLFSIWHRISIISVLSIFFLNVFLSKFLLVNFLIFYLFSFMLKNPIIIFSISIILITNLLYHILSGLRHLIWDLNFFLSKRSIHLSSKFITSIVIFLQILTTI
uniref:Succinate:cytochrome c oxidoreductase subunit 3 n=1 Tax=Audouinella sp. TaxID=2927089 RepID=A0A8T9EKB3_9FLOR|nr:succinate:cytochrome c oxidoreductase subunit 3 [Audouinella sp.]